MPDTITTWALTADAAGAPMILAADPNVEEAASALALVRLNPATKRYAVEPVGIADHGYAARLAREAVAAAFQRGAEWTRVRPGDLVPPERPAAPERIDRDAVRPGHPAWTAEAETLLGLGGFTADVDDPDRRAARERLVASALAEGWSLRELGHAILTAKAEAADRLHVSALHVADRRDPVALAAGQDDSASVWQRVTRPPRPGETTNAARLAGGGF